MTVASLGLAAKGAAPALAASPVGVRNGALERMADAIEGSAASSILSANARDIESAEQNGVAPHMLDRLRLTQERLAGISAGIREIAAMPDPLGEITGMTRRPNGLLIGKQRVPLGVIGVIFESRPNVAADISALCIKSGNAVLLRGGKEAINSNIAMTCAIRGALAAAGLPEDGVCLVTDTSRDSATELKRLRGTVDVLIPRGGKGLISSVVENSSVPVIETGAGNCHVYVDSAADLDMAVDILFNAKCQRPSVCNSAESLLVARSIAHEFLPRAFERLSEKNVEWRGCPETCAILPSAIPASEEDYFTEYNDYILSCKVVSGVDEAIAHINAHSTAHSEAIITRDHPTAMKFLSAVDSAAVYVNASTRFTDGGEFGLGAEIGISTQKLHARGPVGLDALTSSKYIIFGDGQVR